MYCVHFVWRTTYALLLRCPTSFPSHEPSFHHPSYVVMPSEPLPRRWCVPGHCGLHRSDSALAFRSLEVKSICELSVPVRVERIALSIICRTNGKADRTHYASSAAASLGGFHAHGLPWVSPGYLWRRINIWTSASGSGSGIFLIRMAILIPLLSISNDKIADDVIF